MRPTWRAIDGEDTHLDILGYQQCIYAKAPYMNMMKVLHFEHETKYEQMPYFWLSIISRVTDLLYSQEKVIAIKPISNCSVELIKCRIGQTLPGIVSPAAELDKATKYHDYLLAREEEKLHHEREQTDNCFTRN